jgi:hypothetical protein
MGEAAHLAPPAVALATRLGQEEGRGEALAAFAHGAGAEAALLLAIDVDTGVMLPVAGARQTLPRGARWRALLAAVTAPGPREAEVEALSGEGMQRAVAHSSGTVALVLVGECPDATALEALAPLWGLVGSAVGCELRNRAAGMSWAPREVRCASSLRRRGRWTRRG